MPHDEDWWEREYKVDQRARRAAKPGSGRKSSHAERAAGRPRNRSPDPACSLTRYVASLRWACQDTPGQGPLLPKPAIIRQLAYRCWERSDLLGERAAPRFAKALIALACHWRD